MARESNNASLCKECAAILEDMKQYNEAGALYEEVFCFLFLGVPETPFLTTSCLGIVY